MLGETGTGKSHLAVALAVAACRQRKRVRFTTAAELVTEMIEAQSQLQLTRVRSRWMRYDLVVLDELGYVVMPDAAAELLFQVIAGRAEQAAIIVTTNLPFSEWPSKIPNARLCKAMLDRLDKLSAERTRLDARLTAIRHRMDAAYSDKLDGKLPEDFWERKMCEWRMKEQQVQMAISGLVSAEAGDRPLDAQRVFELANKAHFLYISQNSVEKAKLLRMLCSNFSVDAVNVTPTYRKPFDMIFKRARLEEWSGREDSNLRPPGPEPGALPDCATPRTVLPKATPNTVIHNRMSGDTSCSGVDVSMGCSP